VNGSTHDFEKEGDQGQSRTFVAFSMKRSTAGKIKMLLLTGQPQSGKVAWLDSQRRRLGWKLLGSFFF
jgi:hypothetical protein